MQRKSLEGANARRHDIDLTIRDKDLITGRDCKRLISQALAVYDAHAPGGIESLGSGPAKTAQNLG